MRIYNRSTEGTSRPLDSLGPYARGQKGELTGEGVPQMRAAICLAEEVGEKLGGCEVLLGSLPRDNSGQGALIPANIAEISDHILRKPTRDAPIPS
jgi:hypothetical protein